MVRGRNEEVKSLRRVRRPAGIALIILGEREKRFGRLEIGNGRSQPAATGRLVEALLTIIGMSVSLGSLHG